MLCNFNFIHFCIRLYVNTVLFHCMIFLYRVHNVSVGILCPSGRPQHRDDAARQDAGSAHPGSHGKVGPSDNLKTVILKKNLFCYILQSYICPRVCCTVFDISCNPTNATQALITAASEAGLS
jgi:hypothetical protein